MVNFENKSIRVASAAYMAILQSPVNEWRIEQSFNGVLSDLRNYIAEATGRNPQDVQDEYERIAENG